MRATARRLVRAAYRAAMAALPVAAQRQFFYLCAHRRRADLRDPVRFSEKVNWRMVHDRRPVLSWTCDKLAMKAHAAELAPRVRVPRTLWAGTDLAELARVTLPGRWVLKPNHRSGFVHLGAGRPDVTALRGATAEWLQETHRRYTGEWAYGEADRVFLVEEFLDDGGRPPRDYKFFVFDGEPVFVQVDTDRFGDHRRRLYTAGDWEPLTVRYEYELAPPQDPPVSLPLMREIAGAVAAPFEFMRVDLYEVGGEVWFGETTPYPSGGVEHFDPDGFDVELGERWTLPPRSDVGRR